MGLRSRAGREVDPAHRERQVSPVNERAQVVFYFDYVDPGSYLTDVQLVRLVPPEVEVARHPFELRPPPEDLMDPGSPEWRAYRQSVTELAAAIKLPLASPDFMPWTRKAHELRLHAAEKGLEGPIHDALFKARFEDGADIGRVDVLVGLAVGLGLDLTETKAVLDVDRYADRVAELRRQAEAEGVERTPTVRIGSERLEGPLRIDELRGLLEAARLV